MQAQGFGDKDYLAWNRFVLMNLGALSLAYATERGDDAEAFVRFVRERLGELWQGLGAQGVEGAMLSMVLTLEAMGCRIKSTQTSPENSEIIVEHMPGSEMLDGMAERFGVHLDDASWRQVIGINPVLGDQLFDILGAVADGAGIEYLREETEEGDVRIVLRAW